MEDNRVTTVSRKVELGMEALAGRYRFKNDLTEDFA
jgi:hypothetical protein